MNWFQQFAFNHWKVAMNYISNYPAAAAAAKSLQSCLTLCSPIDGSPPGSTVPGILQARILEWVAISFSNACMHAKSLQSCSTLCNPMASSPPGSSIQGTLQARIPEWVANYPNLCFPGSSVSKEPACSEFIPWVGKISWRRKWQTIPVFLPEKSHGQRSLVGYSPWDTRVRHHLANFTIFQQLKQHKSYSSRFTELRQGTCILALLLTVN